MSSPVEHQLRRVVTWVAASVAVATAVAIPLGFLYAVLRHEYEHVQGAADLAADVVSEFVYANPDTWHFNERRLTDLLGRVSARSERMELRLFRASGELLVSEGPAVQRPEIRRRAAVSDGATEVGYVEVTDSLRPPLLRSGFWGVLGILLGLLVYVALRVVPIRALDRALESLRASQAALHDEVRAKVTALARAEEMGEAMRHLALHDSLTGLPNRALFQDRLQQGLLRCQRTGAPLAVVMFDLDRFKEVNDTLGHPVGDRLLQEVAERIQSAVRRSDTVARLGGDEFALSLPLARPDDARGVAQTVCRALKAPVVLDGRELSVGVSCGVALFPTHGTDPKVLLQRADVAMYQAKRTRGGVCLYDPARDPNTPTRLQQLSDLQLALERDEFLVYYQPKVAISSSEVLGVEALVRWARGGGHGVVSPAEFVPLAEETKLIAPLTLWVLTRALEDLVWWQGRGIDLTMAVNLSASNLEDPDLPEVVERLLARTGVAPARLTLEITESAVMTDPGHALDVLSRLRRAGVRLSVDDFGTGYSSLAYLQRLPATEIKIDRTFVSGMAHDRGNTVIVRSTINLAHDLGLSVVAEGIEDAETWQTLGALGCDAGQGFYLARPMPGERFLDWLQGSATFARTA